MDVLCERHLRREFQSHSYGEDNESCHSHTSLQLVHRGNMKLSLNVRRALATTFCLVVCARHYSHKLDIFMFGGFVVVYRISAGPFVPPTESSM